MPSTKIKIIDEQPLTPEPAFCKIGDFLKVVSKCNGQTDYYQVVLSRTGSYICMINVFTGKFEDAMYLPGLRDNPKILLSSIYSMSGFPSHMVDIQKITSATLTFSTE